MGVYKMSLLHCIVLSCIVARTRAMADSRRAEQLTRGVTAQKPLTITTLYSAPYVMPGRDGQMIGLLPDLLAAIKRDTRLDYKLRLVRDGRYGSLRFSSQSKSTTWNGMIGEIINGRADAAAADLTVSYMRELFVDFTIPFMSSRLKVLLRRRKNERSPEIPTTLSEALKQNYKFLVISGGSTHSFFKHSSNSFYSRIYSTMKDDSLVKSLMDGVRRLRSQEKTAFITESNTVDMITSQYCDLTTLGDQIGPEKFFSLAVRQGNAELRETLNRAILKLAEVGYLEMLRHKWWNARRPCA